jgi:uncharacterized protein (TIGR03437 family)
VSASQINAQIPYDVPVSAINTSLPFLVLPGNAVTGPVSVAIAVASPAIFTKNQSGTGQGEVFDASGELVEPGHAAKAGDSIVIECAGLGAVNPPVAAGVAAPSPPSVAVNPVSVTVGGIPAKVLSATLRPGRYGVYQVMAYVPAGVAPGDAVPIQLRVKGQVSPPVTIAIK